MIYPLQQFFRTGDGIGVINSVLCLVHCMAMPVLIVTGAGFFDHPSIS